MSRGRLQAAFVDPADLERSLEALRAAGFEDRRLEVRSSVPLEAEGLPGRRRSLVLAAALLGGLGGGLTAWGLAAYTTLAYPLTTGGMPLLAGPPMAIVTYEGTALGIILATVAAVLLEAGLLRRARLDGPLDHLVAEGRLLVSVEIREGGEGKAARDAVTGAVEVAGDGLEA